MFQNETFLKNIELDKIFTLFFIRTSKFKFRLTALNCFENLRLDCSYIVSLINGCKQCNCYFFCSRELFRPHLPTK